MSEPLSRRKSCRLPEGEACASVGKRGLCAKCITPETRIKMQAGQACPESRAKKSAAKMVWPDCPDEMREDYDTLVKAYRSRRVARRILQPDWEG